MRVIKVRGGSKNYKYKMVRGRTVLKMGKKGPRPGQFISYLDFLPLISPSFSISLILVWDSQDSIPFSNLIHLTLPSLDLSSPRSFLLIHSCLPRYVRCHHHQASIFGNTLFGADLWRCFVVRRRQGHWWVTDGATNPTVPICVCHRWARVPGDGPENLGSLRRCLNPMTIDPFLSQFVWFVLSDHFSKP